MDYSKLWYLSKIGFLDSIPKSVSLEFLEHIQHFFFRKNSLVQEPGKHKEELCFVKTGCIRFYTINTGGNEFTYSILGPGSTYGNLRTFPMSTDNFYIETINDTHLCSIPESSLIPLAKKYPVIFHNTMKIFGERLQERERMLHQLALGSVKDRIIYLLQTLYDRYGMTPSHSDFCPIELPLTQKELANMIGATREATSSTLNALAREGVIRIPKRKRIELHRSIAADNPLPGYIQQMYIDAGDTTI